MAETTDMQALIELQRERLEWDKAQAEQKRKEEDAKSGPAGIASTALGGAAAIGGMIPSLLAGPQKRQLEAFQRGQGAGAAMARQTASEAAGRVVGASTAQPGAGRGGALREGLRAADQIVQTGAQQAAIQAGREGLAATAMLNRNELRRRQAFATLGAGSAQMLAGVGGMLAAAKDQGPAQPDQTAADAVIGAGQAAPLSGIDPITGMRTQPGGIQLTGEVHESPGPGVRDQFGLASGTPLSQQEPTRPGYGTPAGQLATESFLGLEHATAAKQNAADTYVAQQGRQKVTRDDLPPAANDPSLELWFYQQAANWSPTLNQGMHPEVVAQGLLEHGFVPDWEVLGIAPTQEAMSQ